MQLWNAVVRTYWCKNSRNTNKNKTCRQKTKSEMPLCTHAFVQTAKLTVRSQRHWHKVTEYLTATSSNCKQFSYLDHTQQRCPRFNKQNLSRCSRGKLRLSHVRTTDVCNWTQWTMVYCLCLQAHSPSLLWYQHCLHPVKHLGPQTHLPSQPGTHVQHCRALFNK